MRFVLNITIRSARQSDLAILKTFEQGIITAEQPYDSSLRADPISYYDIKAMINSEESEVAIAEFNKTIIASGFAQIRPSKTYVSSDHHAYIGFLYVDPAYRGKGINKKILSYLFEWAKLKQLSDVRLTVYPDNLSAVRAYEKVGFKPYIMEMKLDLDDLTS